ncbi:hypothetical protein MPN29_02410 [Riemerella anatipestifer]|uniref:hypothetical protein n=1 Tax=Riemerella anatipestifer TaxID=34085 RepID=UPI0007ED9AAC|nr:hypothetical protein [Riemerella anatipestifer]MDD1549312.1 hypothetical protein [Riemerella anatipestifer]MDR7832020.1 hypothetical protein [Riemerella anatipestifer]OBP65139.1 hypothetical protein AWB84_01215 [Riemerella anatipestifer]QZO83696.1 hypothetical protein K6T40_02405 [Riemerella anatipestifer]WKV54570.1 hypothetical protein MPN29_02410 [Riemerella anatipestifer]
MFNTISQKVRSRSYSKHLTQSRKNKTQSFIKQFPKNFDFIKENKGCLNAERLDTGAYKVTFQSKATNRTAFAYGGSFEQAYYNMIRMFNLKYSL